jgi:hypothetical protein
VEEDGEGEAGRCLGREKSEHGAGVDEDIAFGRAARSL